MKIDLDVCERIYESQPDVGVIYAGRLHAGILECGGERSFYVDGANLSIRSSYARRVLNRSVLDAYRALATRNRHLELHIWPGVLHGYMMSNNPEAFDAAFDADYREINQVDKAVDTLADQALGFIQTNRDRPFMLALHHHTPHVPLAVPAAYERRYDDIPVGKRHKKKKYAGMMSHLDDAVGRLLDKLDELKLSDNTIVIFTSDNGGTSGQTSNRPYRDGKATLYEGGIRVPLLVRWPGHIKPGSVCNATTVSTDFFPTFLQAAGQPLQPDAHLDGQVKHAIFVYPP
jgi:arylsulfatase A-like enzyme